MDNVLLEINSIYNDYRMDMFIEEYNNFSNIMRNRNNIINESILHEEYNILDKFLFGMQKLIRKIKFILKRLIIKLRDFCIDVFEKIYTRYRSTKVKSWYEIDKLPDDFVIHDVYPLEKQIEAYDKYKYYYDILKKSTDNVTYLSNVINHRFRDPEIDDVIKTIDIIKTESEKLKNINDEIDKSTNIDKTDVHTDEIKKYIKKLWIKDKDNEYRSYKKYLNLQ